MAEVTKQLEVEGVRSFADSFEKLIASTSEKMERLAAASAGAAAAEKPAATAPSLATRQHASLGALQSAVEEALSRAESEHYEQRIWKKDPALWKPNPDDQHEIVDRLGWLVVMEQMRDALPRLNDLRASVHADGVTHVVLLGMGGSSLAPEVLRATFGAASGQPDLLVLDSTDPATILHVQNTVDLDHTLFIVASKSGGTIETLSQYRYFYEKLRQSKGDQAGRQFIAITDAGTKLDTLAQQQKFRHIFRNPTDIGGRYSALSFFGLVPAAILGVDVSALLDRAETMAEACHAGTPARENPGLWLGAILGTLATRGRDKVTFVLSPPISTLGYWLEQLLAESTGKESKGILPVEGEALGAPSVYGDDRLFVYLRTDDDADPGQDDGVAALEQAGQPVVRLPLKDRYDLGGEFFRWEFATAVAGAVLGINAFDQPNVQESKDNTDRILKAYEVSKSLPQPHAVLQTESRNVSLIADGALASKLRESVSLQAALETYALQADSGDYFALLAYLQHTPETAAALERIRLRLRDSRRVATTLGYGPRFQHSTGQLHKGGANTGVFIQFVATDHEDVEIPDAPYTFSVLKAAQALGDFDSLEAHHRRVIRVDLGNDIAAGLAELQAALDAAKLD
jgi:glucose-6-phosphate isomerase